MRFAKKNKQTTRTLRCFAFTLAEVLITLGIIGVVAAVTIPNLIANYQKTQYVTALKKAYTTTNQALQQMAADYGCVGDLKCTGLFSSTIPDQHNALGKALVKYFSTSKICGTDVNKGCWPVVTGSNYDGSNPSDSVNFDARVTYKFITADGISFMIENFANNCLTDGTGGSTDFSMHKTNNMTQTCGFIRVDVNGLKKPNLYGRDTFSFFITNGKGPMLYPRGGADDKYGGADSSWRNGLSGNIVTCYPGYRYGYMCTGRILEEGWQMNY